MAPDEEDWDGEGKCHICHEIKYVRYCPACEHYFCDPCRERWWSRGLAYIKEKVGGKTPGCCFISKED